VSPPARYRARRADRIRVPHSLRRVPRVVIAQLVGAFTLQHAIDGRGGALRTEKTTRFIKVLRRVTRVR
jgi:hypothetical protein